MRQKKVELDRLTKEQRSLLMSKVQGKNTKPELSLRRLLHKNGYRFRLHRKDLPGSPDIVFPSRKKAIFVHGCFWHRHMGCKKTTMPKTRAEFWKAKFDSNINRDIKNIELLRELGWDIIIVWECELKNADELKERVFSFLQTR